MKRGVFTQAGSLYRNDFLKRSADLPRSICITSARLRRSNSFWGGRIRSFAPLLRAQDLNHASHDRIANLTSKEIGSTAQP
jgi:hypothetical protein